MSMATPAPQEPAEAVIISGPRKGKFITVPNGESELTPEAEALLGSLVADAQRMAESAQAAAAEADALLQDLRQAGRQ
jgi:hypothetical protein